jgi:predicted Zn-dependent protease
MAHSSLIAASFTLVLIFAASAPSQIHQETGLGRSFADELDRRDGRLNDPPLIAYLQSVADRLADSASSKPVEIRLTRSSERYARLQPHRVLYLSAGLAREVQSEAELAGLLAHMLVHAGTPYVPLRPDSTIPLFVPSCALSSTAFVMRTSWGRELEREANVTAVNTLRAAGYDPAALLDLLTRLTHQQPALARAIVTEDLLNLHSSIEDDIPGAGYRVDTSQFLEQRAKLEPPAARTRSVPSLRRP